MGPAPAEKDRAQGKKLMLARNLIGARGPPHHHRAIRRHRHCYATLHRLHHLTGDRHRHHPRSCEARSERCSADRSIRSDHHCGERCTEARYTAAHHCAER